MRGLRGLGAEVGLGVTLAVVATILRWGLGQIAPGILPFAVYFPAAAVASLFGGWRAGAVVGVLGAMAGGTFFLPGPSLPGPSLPGRPDTTMVVNLLLFVGTMAVVISGAAYQRTLSARLAGTNKSLADRDDYYNALFDGMSEGFALCEAIFDEFEALKDYYIIEINPALQEILGVGPEVVGGKFSATPGDNRRWLKMCDQVLKTGQPASFEAHNPQTNLWHEIHITRVSTTRMAQFFFDITARKRAELRQAELFGEMNHRVRNNLTMVASLLNLQARDVGAEIRDQLLKAAARMQSIAEVHAALYRGSSHESVELGSYLSDLCANLSKALLSDQRIAINVRAEPVTVTVDMAIPLGMAVTEMVTNAVKYAYPSPGGGDIWVSLERHDQELSVSVADTGIGSEQTVEESGRLGMRLIQSFAKQLNGRLSIDHDQGTTVEIRAPLSNGAILS
jgi:two-component sensor histidine kinase/PAS domain-containing protein